jgi:hypothetical protein
VRRRRRRPQSDAADVSSDDYAASSGDPSGLSASDEDRQVTSLANAACNRTEIQLTTAVTPSLCQFGVSSSSSESFSDDQLHQQHSRHFNDRLLPSIGSEQKLNFGGWQTDRRSGLTPAALADSVELQQQQSPGSAIANNAGMFRVMDSSMSVHLYSASTDMASARDVDKPACSFKGENQPVTAAGVMNIDETRKSDSSLISFPSSSLVNGRQGRELSDGCSYETAGDDITAYQPNQSEHFSTSPDVDMSLLRPKAKSRLAARVSNEVPKTDGSAVTPADRRPRGDWTGAGVNDFRASSELGRKRPGDTSRTEELMHSELVNRDSGYHSVSRQSALMFQMSLSESDEKAEDDAFVEAGNVDGDTNMQQGNDGSKTNGTGGRNDENNDDDDFAFQNGVETVVSVHVDNETDESWNDGEEQRQSSDGNCNMAATLDRDSLLVSAATQRSRRPASVHDDSSSFQVAEGGLRPRSFSVDQSSASTRFQPVLLQTRSGSDYLSLSRFYLQSSRQGDLPYNDSCTANSSAGGGVPDPGRFDLVHFKAPEPRRRTKQQTSCNRSRSAGSRQSLPEDLAAGFDNSVDSLEPLATGGENSAMNSNSDVLQVSASSRISSPETAEHHDSDQPSSAGDSNELILCDESATSVDVLSDHEEKASAMVQVHAATGAHSESSLECSISLPTVRDRVASSEPDEAAADVSKLETEAGNETEVARDGPKVDNVTSSTDSLVSDVTGIDSDASRNVISGLATGMDNDMTLTSDICSVDLELDKQNNTDCSLPRTSLSAQDAIVTDGLATGFVALVDSYVDDGACNNVCGSDQGNISRYPDASQAVVKDHTSVVTADENETAVGPSVGSGVVITATGEKSIVNSASCMKAAGTERYAGEDGIAEVKDAEDALEDKQSDRPLAVAKDSHVLEVEEPWTSDVADRNSNAETAEAVDLRSALSNEQTVGSSTADVNPSLLEVPCHGTSSALDTSCQVGESVAECEALNNGDLDSSVRISRSTEAVLHSEGLRALNAFDAGEIIDRARGDIIDSELCHEVDADIVNSNSSSLDDNTDRMLGEISGRTWSECSKTGEQQSSEDVRPKTRNVSKTDDDGNDSKELNKGSDFAGVDFLSSSAGERVTETNTETLDTVVSHVLPEPFPGILIGDGNINESKPAGVQHDEVRLRAVASDYVSCIVAEAFSILQREEFADRERNSDNTIESLPENERFTYAEEQEVDFPQRNIQDCSMDSQVETHVADQSCLALARTTETLAPAVEDRPYVVDDSNNISQSASVDDSPMIDGIHSLSGCVQRLGDSELTVEQTCDESCSSAAAITATVCESTHEAERRRTSAAEEKQLTEGKLSNDYEVTDRPFVIDDDRSVATVSNLTEALELTVSAVEQPAVNPVESSVGRELKLDDEVVGQKNDNIQDLMGTSDRRELNDGVLQREDGAQNGSSSAGKEVLRSLDDDGRPEDDAEDRSLISDKSYEDEGLASMDSEVTRRHEHETITVNSGISTEGSDTASRQQQSESSGERQLLVNAADQESEVSIDGTTIDERELLSSAVESEYSTDTEIDDEPTTNVGGRHSVVDVTETDRTTDGEVLHVCNTETWVGSTEGQLELSAGTEAASPDEHVFAVVGQMSRDEASPDSELQSHTSEQNPTARDGKPVFESTVAAVDGQNKPFVSEILPEEQSESSPYSQTTVAGGVATSIAEKGTTESSRRDAIVSKNELEALTNVETEDLRAGEASAVIQQTTEYESQSSVAAAERLSDGHFASFTAGEQTIAGELTSIDEISPEGERDHGSFVARGLTDINQDATGGNEIALGNEVKLSRDSELTLKGIEPSNNDDVTTADKPIKSYTGDKSNHEPHELPADGESTVDVNERTSDEEETSADGKREPLTGGEVAVINEQQMLVVTGNSSDTEGEQLTGGDETTVDRRTRSSVGDVKSEEPVDIEIAAVDSKKTGVDEKNSTGTERKTVSEVIEVTAGYEQKSSEVNDVYRQGTNANESDRESASAVIAASPVKLENSSAVCNDLTYDNADEQWSVTETEVSLPSDSMLTAGELCLPDGGRLMTNTEFTQLHKTQENGQAKAADGLKKLDGEQGKSTPMETSTDPDRQRHAYVKTTSVDEQKALASHQISTGGEAATELSVTAMGSRDMQEITSVDEASHNTELEATVDAQGERHASVDSGKEFSQDGDITTCEPLEASDVHVSAISASELPTPLHVKSSVGCEVGTTDKQQTLVVIDVACEIQVEPSGAGGVVTVDGQHTFLMGIEGDISDAQKVDFVCDRNVVSDVKIPTDSEMTEHDNPRKLTEGKCSADKENEILVKAANDGVLEVSGEISPERQGKQLHVWNSAHVDEREVNRGETEVQTTADQTTSAAGETLEHSVRLSSNGETTPSCQQLALESCLLPTEREIRIAADGETPVTVDNRLHADVLTAIVNEDESFAEGTNVTVIEQTSYIADVTNEERCDALLPGSHLTLVQNRTTSSEWEYSTGRFENTMENGHVSATDGETSSTDKRHPLVVSETLSDVSATDIEVKTLNDDDKLQSKDHRSSVSSEKENEAISQAEGGFFETSEDCGTIVKSNGRRSDSSLGNEVTRVNDLKTLVNVEVSVDEEIKRSGDLGMNENEGKTVKPAYSGNAAGGPSELCTDGPLMSAIERESYAVGEMSSLSANNIETVADLPTASAGSCLITDSSARNETNLVETDISAEPCTVNGEQQLSLVAEKLHADQEVPVVATKREVDFSSDAIEDCKPLGTSETSSLETSTELTESATVKQMSVKREVNERDERQMTTASPVQTLTANESQTDEVVLSAPVETETANEQEGRCVHEILSETECRSFADSCSTMPDERTLSEASETLTSIDVMTHAENQIEVCSDQQTLPVIKMSQKFDDIGETTADARVKCYAVDVENTENYKLAADGRTTEVSVEAAEEKLSADAQTESSIGSGLLVSDVANLSNNYQMTVGTEQLSVVADVSYNRQPADGEETTVDRQWKTEERNLKSPAGSETAAVDSKKMKVEEGISTVREFELFEASEVEAGHGQESSEASDVSGERENTCGIPIVDFSHTPILQEISTQVDDRSAIVSIITAVSDTAVVRDAATVTRVASDAAMVRDASAANDAAVDDAATVRGTTAAGDAAAVRDAVTVRDAATIRNGSAATDAAAVDDAAAEGDAAAVRGAAAVSDAVTVKDAPTIRDASAAIDAAAVDDAAAEGDAAAARGAAAVSDAVTVRDASVAIDAAAVDDAATVNNAAAANDAATVRGKAAVSGAAAVSDAGGSYGLKTLAFDDTSISGESEQPEGGQMISDSKCQLLTSGEKVSTEIVRVPFAGSQMISVGEQNTSIDRSPSGSDHLSKLLENSHAGAEDICEQNKPSFNREQMTDEGEDDSTAETAFPEQQTLDISADVTYEKVDRPDSGETCLRHRHMPAVEHLSADGVTNVELKDTRTRCPSPGDKMVDPSVGELLLAESDTGMTSASKEEISAKEKFLTGGERELPAGDCSNQSITHFGGTPADRADKSRIVSDRVAAPEQSIPVVQEISDEGQNTPSSDWSSEVEPLRPSDDEELSTNTGAPASLVTGNVQDVSFCTETCTNLIDRGGGANQPDRIDGNIYVADVEAIESDRLHKNDSPSGSQVKELNSANEEDRNNAQDEKQLQSAAANSSSVSSDGQVGQMRQVGIVCLPVSNPPATDSSQRSLTSNDVNKSAELRRDPSVDSSQQLDLRSVDSGAKPLSSKAMMKSGRSLSELRDTEVLRIDLKPDLVRAHDVPEGAPEPTSDVEIIISGHSTIGFGRETDVDYQVVGLQPVGTQRPQYRPCPERVLLDDISERYPESFWHAALDIEIKPRNRRAAVTNTTSRSLDNINFSGEMIPSVPARPLRSPSTTYQRFDAAENQLREARRQMSSIESGPNRSRTQETNATASNSQAASIDSSRHGTSSLAASATFDENRVSAVLSEEISSADDIVVSIRSRQENSASSLSADHTPGINSVETQNILGANGYHDGSITDKGDRRSFEKSGVMTNTTGANRQDNKLCAASNETSVEVERTGFVHDVSNDVVSQSSIQSHVMHGIQQEEVNVHEDSITETTESPLRAAGACLVSERADDRLTNTVEVLKVFGATSTNSHPVESVQQEAVRWTDSAVSEVCGVSGENIVISGQSQHLVCGPSRVEPPVLLDTETVQLTSSIQSVATQGVVHPTARVREIIDETSLVRASSLNMETVESVVDNAQVGQTGGGFSGANVDVMPSDCREIIANEQPMKSEDLSDWSRVNDAAAVSTSFARIWRDGLTMTVEKTEGEMINSRDTLNDCGVVILEQHNEKEDDDSLSREENTRLTNNSLEEHVGIRYDDSDVTDARVGSAHAKEIGIDEVELIDGQTAATAEHADRKPDDMKCEVSEDKKKRYEMYGATNTASGVEPVADIENCLSRPLEQQDEVIEVNTNEVQGRQITRNEVQGNIDTDELGMNSGKYKQEVRGGEGTAGRQSEMFFEAFEGDTVTGAKTRLRDSAQKEQKEARLEDANSIDEQSAGNKTANERKADDEYKESCPDAGARVTSTKKGQEVMNYGVDDQSNLGDDRCRVEDRGRVTDNDWSCENTASEEHSDLNRPQREDEVIHNDSMTAATVSRLIEHLPDREVMWAVMGEQTVDNSRLSSAADVNVNDSQPECDRQTETGCKHSEADELETNGVEIWRENNTANRSDMSVAHLNREDNYQNPSNLSEDVVRLSNSEQVASHIREALKSEATSSTEPTVRVETEAKRDAGPQTISTNGGGARAEFEVDQFEDIGAPVSTAVHSGDRCQREGRETAEPSRKYNSAHLLQDEFTVNEDRLLHQTRNTGVSSGEVLSQVQPSEPAACYASDSRQVSISHDDGVQNPVTSNVNELIGSEQMPSEKRDNDHCAVQLPSDEELAKEHHESKPEKTSQQVYAPEVGRVDNNLHMSAHYTEPDASSLATDADAAYRNRSRLPDDFAQEAEHSADVLHGTELATSQGADCRQLPGYSLTASFTNQRGVENSELRGSVTDVETLHSLTGNNFWPNFAAAAATHEDSAEYSGFIKGLRESDGLMHDDSDILSANNSLVHCQPRLARCSSMDKLTSSSSTAGSLCRTSSETSLNQEVSRNLNRSSMLGANPEMSQSDQDLLGSDSILYDDLLPTFKELPFHLNMDNSDIEAFAKDVMGEDGAGYENLLPQYRELPPGLYSGISFLGDDGSVSRANMTDVCTETAFNEDQRVGETSSHLTTGGQQLNVEWHQRHSEHLLHVAEAEADDMKAVDGATSSSSRDELQERNVEVVADNDQSGLDANARGDSMDSITYVFVGHGASSLERFEVDQVVDSCEGKLVRSSSEPHSHLIDISGRRQRRRSPAKCYNSPEMTRSQSARYISPSSFECPANNSLSLNCLDVMDFNDEDIPLEQIFGRMHDVQQSGSAAFDDARREKTGYLHPASGTEIRVVANQAENEREANEGAKRINGQGLVRTADVTVGLSNEARTTGMMQEAAGLQNVAQEVEDVNRADAQASQTCDIPVTGTVSLTVISKNVSDQTVCKDSMTSASAVGSPQLSASSSRGCDVRLTAPLGGAIQQVTEHRPSHIEKWQSVSCLEARSRSHEDPQLTRRVASTNDQWDRDENLSWTQYGHDMDWIRTGLRSNEGSRTIETQTYPEVRVIETQTSSANRILGTQTADCWTEDEASAGGQRCFMDTGVGASPPATPVNMSFASVSRANVPMQSAAVDGAGWHASFSRMTAGRDVENDKVEGSINPTASLPEVSGGRVRRHVDDYFPSPFDNDFIHCEQQCSNTTPDDHQWWHFDESSAYDRVDRRDRNVNMISENSTPLTVMGASGRHDAVAAGSRTNTLRFRQPARSMQSQSYQTYGNTRVENRHVTISPSDSSDEEYTSPAYRRIDEEEALLDSDEGDQHLLMTSLRTPRDAPTDAYVANSRSMKARNNERHQQQQQHYTSTHVSNAAAQFDDIMTASPPVAHQTSPSDGANMSTTTQDSGVVGNAHSSSTLNDASFASCGQRSDKSTDTCVDAAADWWDDELERLRRERQRIVDMLARDVIPSRIQVELAEAQLNYLIGQTDMLLQTIDDPLDWEHRPWRSRDQMDGVVEGAEFLARYRQRLVDSQHFVDAEIERLERARLSTGYYVQQPDGRILHRTHRTPMERERYLRDLRRIEVSATSSRAAASSPRPPPGDQQPRMKARRLMFSRSLAGSRHSSLNASVASSIPVGGFGSESVGEETRMNEFSSAAPSSFTADDRTTRRDGSLTSLNSEMSRLLTECQDARERARAEIDYAIEALRRTSPAWTLFSPYNR